MSRQSQANHPLRQTLLYYLIYSVNKTIIYKNEHQHQLKLMNGIYVDNWVPFC